MSVDTNIYFPVIEQAVFAGALGSAVHAPSHKAIVRTDTNEVLGIHSNGYKLVKHEEVFPVVEDVFNKLLDTNGMQIHNTVDNSGARVLRTYLFPEHEIRLPKDDNVALQVRVANSLDASFSFVLQAGGIRWACWNGCVSGAVMANVKHKHTAGLDVEYVLGVLNRSLQDFENNGELWKRWSMTLVSNEQATAILTSLATSKKMLEELKVNWQLQRCTLGATAWALYNVMTEWSTHTSTKAAQSTALLQREAKVRAVLPQLEKLAA